MNKKHFTPLHLCADVDDLTGNNGIGRYIILPGSDGRAKEISQYFNDLSIKSHPRGHNLYLGSISHKGKNIDVATVSSGMGCPSMEIILHELFHLGGKRFLRVGTAGSLQHDLVKIGDIINVHASVRDEHTTTDYLPIAVPAVASLEFISAISYSAKQLGLLDKIHTGTVHCKSSLYAREFGNGPRAITNKSYIKLLTHGGILASEMETATLFIQSQLYHYQLSHLGKSPSYQVLCGAILGIQSISSLQFATQQQESIMTKELIELALTAIKNLSNCEV